MHASIYPDEQIPPEIHTQESRSRTSFSRSKDFENSKEDPIAQTPCDFDLSLVLCRLVVASARAHVKKSDERKTEAVFEHDVYPDFSRLDFCQV